MWRVVSAHCHGSITPAIIYPSSRDISRFNSIMAGRFLEEIGQRNLIYLMQNIEATVTAT